MRNGSTASSAIADPAPEQLAEVRGDATKRKVAQAAATPPAQPAVTERVSGAELARRAIEEGRGEQIEQASGPRFQASLAAAVPRAEERTEAGRRSRRD